MAVRCATARAAVSVVEITGIAAGGDGVGRLDDGMTVFVPRAAPGDVVDVAIVDRRRRYARARIEAVRRASTDRTEPRCPHYVKDRCGGCQLQHLSPEAQLRWKSRIVGEALRRIGRVDVADPEIETGDRAWRYRTRITLAARGGRIGLRRTGTPGDVFDLEDCCIAAEPLMTLWQAVRAARPALPSTLEGLQLRQDRDGRCHVVVHGDAQTRAWDPAPLVEVLGPSVTIWWQPHRGAARAVAGVAEAFPALAFEQVNPALATRIRCDAVAALAPRAGQRIWDLYGGVGDTARQLATAGVEVWSVDADRRAIAWARKQGNPGAAAAIHWLPERVEEALPRLPRPDGAIVNPPRIGLAAPIAEGLNRWGSSQLGARLVYVSCDPATLARDLDRLKAFRVVSVRAYDLFPQTSHIETLAVLEAA